METVQDVPIFYKTFLRLVRNYSQKRPAGSEKLKQFGEIQILGEIKRP
jgi:hypothetical protein